MRISFDSCGLLPAVLFKRCFEHPVILLRSSHVRPREAGKLIRHYNFTWHADSWRACVPQNYTTGSWNFCCPVRSPHLIAMPWSHGPTHGCRGVCVCARDCSYNFPQDNRWKDKKSTSKRRASWLITPSSFVTFIRKIYRSKRGMVLVKQL